MKSKTEELLSLISDWKGVPETGAYNIREDSGCAGRRSSENVSIESKTDLPGIDIRVKPYTKGEKIYIPACVTHSDVDDLVYNDFYIGEGCDVTIVAGCGVHSDGHEDAKHNGIHRFFLEKDARVVYLEKHIGTGNGDGQRIINPVTHAQLAENSYMLMDTTQIKGVDSTLRKTSAVLEAGATLVVKEKLMTDGHQVAKTDFDVTLKGENSGVELQSRSVAKGHSYQAFRSIINGEAPCTGHSACDAIIMDEGKVSATPELTAAHVDAALIHEAAIGKIAGEQLTKLMTLGLSEHEAEEKIIAGFLR